MISLDFIQIDNADNILVNLQLTSYVKLSTNVVYITSSLMICFLAISSAKRVRCKLTGMQSHRATKGL